MVRNAQGNFPRIAFHKLAEFKILSVRYQPGAVTGPGSENFIAAPGCQSSECWLGMLATRKHYDKPLVGGTTLERNQSCHGLAIRGIARKPPHALRCLGNHATQTQAAGRGFYVKAGQGAKLGTSPRPSWPEFHAGRGEARLARDRSSRHRRMRARRASPLRDYQLDAPLVFQARRFRLRSASAPVVLQGFSHRAVIECDDLRGEVAGVLRAIDGDGRDRNARRHL